MRSSATWLMVASLAAIMIGCSSGASNSIHIQTPAAVYWTFDNTAPAVQLEGAAYPLTSTSTVTLSVLPSVGNALNDASPLLFDAQGRLWVANATGTPNTIAVFNPPFSATMNAAFVLTLTGCQGLFGMAFDHSGNLWAGCNGSGTAIEYAGPFNSTATLSAANTLTVPGAGYPAFDAAGNLYVARDHSPYAIDFFPGPVIANGASPTKTLLGVTEPFALVFDATGDLYAGQRGSVVRYNSTNLNNGSTPDIVNATGQAAGDFAGELVLDTFGNLYYSDCGTATNHIYIFPTGSQAFSITLAPVTFSDANTAGCVWGVAVH